MLKSYFNSFYQLLIVDRRCVSVRDTGRLGDLQTESDPSHSPCGHPPDPGGSDRCQPKYLPSTLSFPCVGSVYCVVVVAIERYLSVCRPFQQKVVWRVMELCLTNLLFRLMDGSTSSSLWLSPLHIISLNFWSLRQFMEELIRIILAGERQLVENRFQQIHQSADCSTETEKKTLLK